MRSGLSVHRVLFCHETEHQRVGYLLAEFLVTILIGGILNYEYSIPKK